MKGFIVSLSLVTSYTIQRTKKEYASNGAESQEVEIELLTFFGVLAGT